MTAMFSKVWIINIVLAALIIFCWIRVLDGRYAEEIVSAKTGSIKKIFAINESISVSIARPASALEYDGIIENNLFSSDRTFTPEPPEPENVVETKEEEVRISGEKIVLYGIVMLDGLKKALINNPMRKPGEREFLWITEGERISNLRVTRIDSEQLLFADGAVQYKIDLYDPRKARSQTSPPVQVLAPQQRSSPQVISADPVPSPAAPSGTSAMKSSPAQSRPAEVSKQGVSGDNDEYVIIDTPFGEIRRKKTK